MKIYQEAIIALLILFAMVSISFYLTFDNSISDDHELSPTKIVIFIPNQSHPPDIFLIYWNSNLYNWLSIQGYDVKIIWSAQYLISINPDYVITISKECQSVFSIGKAIFVPYPVFNNWDVLDYDAEILDILRMWEP